jgi:hypothetical protein
MCSNLTYLREVRRLALDNLGQLAIPGGWSWSHGPLLL